MRIIRELYKGDKNHVNVDFIVLDATDSKDLNLEIKIHFAGKYDPLSLLLSKEMVLERVRINCFDTIFAFVDSFFTAPDQEVAK